MQKINLCKNLNLCHKLKFMNKFMPKTTLCHKLFHEKSKFMQKLTLCQNLIFKKFLSALCLWGALLKMLPYI